MVLATTSPQNLEHILTIVRENDEKQKQQITDLESKVQEQAQMIDSQQAEMQEQAGEIAQLQCAVEEQRDQHHPTKSSGRLRRDRQAMRRKGFLSLRTESSSLSRESKM